MKSFLKHAVALMLSSVIFLSCATTKIDYAAMSQELTPENSVVLIYPEPNELDYDLVQINPDYPADRFTVLNDAGCTKPLVPGSCYFKAFNDDMIERDYCAGTPCIADSMPLSYLNAEQTKKISVGRKIVVPSKPGLYVCYPQYDIDAIQESDAVVIGKLSNDIEEWKKSSLVRYVYRKRFQKCAKLYAGTAWEPLIQKYVEEWSK